MWARARGYFWTYKPLSYNGIITINSLPLKLAVADYDAITDTCHSRRLTMVNYEAPVQQQQQQVCCPIWAFAMGQLDAKHQRLGRDQAAGSAIGAPSSQSFLTPPELDDQFGQLPSSQDNPKVLISADDSGSRRCDVDSPTNSDLGDGPGPSQFRRASDESVDKGRGAGSGRSSKSSSKSSIISADLSRKQKQNQKQQMR